MGGQDTTPWQIGPNFFVDPTFADIYDHANDNKPVAGMVATADIHLGMLGHGSFWNGGDRDIAMTRSPDVQDAPRQPRATSGTSRRRRPPTTTSPTT